MRRLCIALALLLAASARAQGLPPGEPASVQAQAELAPPAVMAPRPRAKLQAGMVDFAWESNLQAAGYRLQIAAVDAAGRVDFAQPLVDTPGIAQPRAQIRLDGPGLYQWRLAGLAADGSSGPWGEASSFDLRPEPGPPQGGMAADGKTVELSWGSGPPGTRYLVDLARDADFKDIASQADLDAAQWTLPRPGQPGSYYFRYRRVEPDGYVSPLSGSLRIEIKPDLSGLWFLLISLLMI